MMKTLSILTILFVLSLGFVTGSQASSMARSGLTTYDATNLMGIMVKSRDGAKLGQIFDLVVDSHGRVDFAIVSQVIPSNLADPWPGHIVAVPFGALKISEGKSQRIQVVFSADKEKFYEAPDFYGNKDLANRQKVTEVDRYFGIQPSWMEGGHTAAGQAGEDWMLLRILDARRWDHWGEKPQNFQG